MNRAFGVQVTVNDVSGGGQVAQPLVIVARDERDAELIAAAAGGSDAQTLRELTDEEIASYGLDLEKHGDTKALPALNL